MFVLIHKKSPLHVVKGFPSKGEERLVDTPKSVKLEELSKAEKLRLIEISLRYTLPKKIIEEPITNDFKVEIVQSVCRQIKVDFFRYKLSEC